MMDYCRLLRLRYLSFFILLCAFCCCECKVASLPLAIPTPKGERLLGIEISYAENADIKSAVVDAFGKAKELGINFGHLSITWEYLESKPQQFSDPHGVLEFGDYFYTYNNLMVFLTICSPINTTRRDIPDDLKHKKLDDPEVIKRFKNLLDFVLPRLTHADLICLSIGNEIDIYLEKNKHEIESFKNFFIRIKEYATNLNPGLKISFTTTLYGATDYLQDEIFDVNCHTDYICLTYYPLNPDYTVKHPVVVDSDFTSICDLYRKPIYFQECGYPSSSALLSSEQMQAEFTKQVFKNWDLYHEQIKIISFYELTDWAEESVTDYLAYLKLPETKNATEFLKSLGLRTYARNGADKHAFSVLKQAAEQRGW